MQVGQGYRQATLEDARTLITQFETDDRVRLVELNVNFYDIEPH